MPKYALLPLVLVLVLHSGARAQEARLLRFPASHGNQLVFTYAGDLYTVSGSGGVARKLTGHNGFEMFARFSPDGKRIAFTGQYDGNTEVYVIPARGGVPRRLTFTETLGRDDVSDRMGPNNIVMGWKHDSEHIVFRSRMHQENAFLGQLYTVSIKGGLPEPLPLPRGGFCSFSPDDSKLAYNRVFREFRTWKRYRGGMTDDVWIYDFNTKKTENITNNPASDIIPMWSGDKIYYLSDRDEHKRMNLYVYETLSKTTRQLTHFDEFDIKFPSLGDKAIVFEYGGYLFRLDLDTERVAKVPVQILEDQVAGRGGLTNVSKNVAYFSIAPDGKRAVFGARGDIFTVPAHTGPTRNLTGTTGVHERDPEWSPDGKHIAFISDASGEDEIYVTAQDGSGSAQQLTKGADTYKYEIKWSPDSKKILWSDKKLRLQYIDVASRAVTPVAQGKAWEIRDFAWSPDSKWIAYVHPERRTWDRIVLYSVEKNTTLEVTDTWFDSRSPVFSADGKYLFFVSDREFNPTYALNDFNHVYQDMSRIFLVTLARETESPFKPKSDEVGVEPPKPEPAKKEGVVVKVDADGLKDRIIELPIPASSYRNLVSAGGALYYLRHGSKDPRALLQMYDLGQHKETALGQLENYEVSADQKKMIVFKDGNYGIIDLPKGPVVIAEPLNLSGMEVKLDRHKEWRQIFNECWRQMRDFFYDPNLHGVDWPAVRQKYEPLLAHVNHRADLTYVIGEMIGELSAGHTYVGGGDMPQPARIKTGLLGAQLKRDDKTGYYRIVKIIRGQNWDRSVRSPLTELGVNAREGDFILAVNGQPTNEMTNIYEALVNTVDKQVVLRINSEPTAKGSRDVTVIPTGDETQLYYYAWVQDNIKKVNDATAGRVGYLHIPEMLQPGLNEFTKYYYPQLQKKALIVDVRGNGGGNVSPMIIERLRRDIAMVGIARNTTPNVDPGGLLLGPMVCLLNEFSASDGDLFPYRFRKAKLGPLIGKRSWGGVVGIRGSLPIVDGGFLNKPEFARYDVEGKAWIIEGHGVEPDIVVDNDPAREYAGIDDQLSKAIEVVLEELKTKTKSLPPAPPYPKK
ncbi:MAG TPA: PDZ domain-containing protein [Gemmataceae bacterium]|nr:PDZ domain-containing protein [Gemmataceae bacterium]